MQNKQGVRMIYRSLGLSVECVDMDTLKECRDKALEQLLEELKIEFNTDTLTIPMSDIEIYTFMVNA